MKQTDSGLLIPDAAVEEKKVEKPPEMEILVHLFESTITFFRLVNKVMIHLKYSRQKRRQIWSALINDSTIHEDDVVLALLNELKPILEEAKIETEKHKASQQSTQTQEVAK